MSLVRDRLPYVPGDPVGTVAYYAPRILGVLTALVCSVGFASFAWAMEGWMLGTIVIVQLVLAWAWLTAAWLKGSL